MQNENAAESESAPVPLATWALAQTTKSPCAKAVLLALAASAGADDIAFVTPRQLGIQTELTAYNASKWLKRLITLGLAKRLGAPNLTTPTAYQLRPSQRESERRMAHMEVKVAGEPIYDER